MSTVEMGSHCDHWLHCCLSLTSQSILLQVWNVKSPVHIQKCQRACSHILLFTYPKPMMFSMRSPMLTQLASINILRMGCHCAHWLHSVSISHPSSFLWHGIASWFRKVTCWIDLPQLPISLLNHGMLSFSQVFWQYFNTICNLQWHKKVSTT